MPPSESAPTSSSPTIPSTCLLYSLRPLPLSPAAHSRPRQDRARVHDERHGRCHQASRRRPQAHRRYQAPVSYTACALCLFPLLLIPAHAKTELESTMKDMADATKRVGADLKLTDDTKHLSLIQPAPFASFPCCSFPPTPRPSSSPR